MKSGLSRRAFVRALIPSATLPAWKTHSSPVGIGEQAAISVKSFGAKGDGVTDDTAAMQRAHDAQKIVYYPAGEYRFSHLTLNGGGILGDGMPTILRCDTGGPTKAIEYLGSGRSLATAFRFEDFQLLGYPDIASMTQGHRVTGISIDSIDGSTVALGRIAGVHFRGLTRALALDNAADYTIEHCKFYFYGESAISIENTGHPDVGDSSIINSHFFNDAKNHFGTAILQRSSGGLRVLGNKFNGGMHSYHLDLKETTSILILSSNSIENNAGAALLFENTINQTARPVRFRQAEISGNQFANNLQDIYFSEISNSRASSYWDIISIRGNLIYHAGSLPSIDVRTARLYSISDNIIWTKAEPMNVPPISISDSTEGTFTRNLVWH